MTYDRVNWQNEPSENTPLSAENLNKMDSAIKELSEMVVANPVEADTDELKKVEIEGTVYKIAGGHELVNASGSTMTQRSKMSFPDSHLTDDSGNNQTIVDIVKEVTTAQWNNATEEGLYYINDKPDSIITAEQVAYGNGNVKQALDGKYYSGSLDDLKTTGFYGIDVSASSNAPSDVPNASKCNVTVNDSSGLITQTLYYTSVAVYVRRFYNNAWNAWVKYEPLKKVTITGTTSSVGSLAIDSGGHNWVILGFSVTQPTSGSYLVQIGFWNKGNRYIHITDEAHNPVANLSISLDIYYWEV